MDEHSNSRRDAGVSEDGSEPPPALALDIVIEDETWTTVEDVPALAQIAAAALSANPQVALHLPAEACLALSGDDRVRELNRAYRAKDKATNVLSFPAPAAPASADAEQGVRFLGDIIMAGGVVRAEAAELGLPIAHHLQHLVVHGLLHLMGYDHETDADAAVMEALETHVLATLGIADPYLLPADEPTTRS